MKIEYARVSTEDQNPDLQLTALKPARCGKIFTDKATGTNAKRPSLTKCLEALKDGDVPTVWKLDRLGRSLRDLIALLDDLRAHGVAFQSGGKSGACSKIAQGSRRTLYRALAASNLCKIG